MTSPVRTTRVQKLLLAAFGVGLFALLLLVLEGALAFLGLGDRSRYDDPFVGFEPGADLFRLEERPGGDVYVTSPNKLAFFNHQEFPARKADGTYRVFALGGSTTAGRPYDAAVAFPRWMELYLAEMDPSRRFEVTNAGAISYASYRIALLMRELVRYEVDLFVIYTGHNEFLEERSYADILREDPRRRRLRRWMGRLRTVTLAREGLRRLRSSDEVTPEAASDLLLSSEVETRLAGWTGLDAYRRDDELRAAILRHFEHSLRQMVRIARDHGAGVIFVRPVSNLKDFSPFKSEPRRPFTPEESRRVDRLLAAGRGALEAGDGGTAAAHFRQLVELDPAYADFHFRLGQARFQSGDFASARASFVTAKDADVAPLRALEAISDLVRAVAAEAEVPLLDLPALLEDDCEARYGHRILGNEHLLDHVHPDMPVHSLVAERVIGLLVERGVVRPAPGWTEAARQAIYDRLVGSVDREYYAYRDLNLAKVLGWAGKLEEAEPPLLRAREVLPDDPEVLLNLGVLYQKTGRPEAAARELVRAAALDPSSPEAHFNLGVSYGMLGRADAGAAALEEALRLRPGYPEARFNLGVLRRRQGDLDGALAALEAVLEKRPGKAEVHREIGLVYRRQGRLDEAAAAFRRALEIDPDDPVARTDLAVVHGRRGEEETAVAELERAIAGDPGYAEAHYNLGVVRARLGLAAEAADAYRRALEIDPSHAEACNNLAILLAGRGELGEARRLLERAVELRPDYAEAHLNLGVVYDQSGLRDPAIQAVERAFELDSDNPRIRQALELLKGSGS